MISKIATVALLSLGASAGPACPAPSADHHSQAIALRIQVAEGQKDLATPVNGWYLTPEHTIGAGINLAGSYSEPVTVFIVNGTSNAEGSEILEAAAGDFAYGLSFTNEKNGVSQGNLNIGGGDRHYYIAGSGAPLLKGPKSFIMCDREIEGQQGRHSNVLMGLAPNAKPADNCVPVTLEARCAEFPAESHVDRTNAYNVRCKPLN